jgi:hypothetical protein
VRARLPTVEVRDRLRELIADAECLSEGLDDLVEDERWRTWNAGGAAFRRPQFKGPGHYTAAEFAQVARNLRDRLASVEGSFEDRIESDRKRAQKRRQT